METFGVGAEDGWYYTDEDDFVDVGELINWLEQHRLATDPVQMLLDELRQGV